MKCIINKNMGEGFKRFNYISSTMNLCLSHKLKMHQVNRQDVPDPMSLHLEYCPASIAYAWSHRHLATKQGMPAPEKLATSFLLNHKHAKKLVLKKGIFRTP